MSWSGRLHRVTLRLLPAATRGRLGEDLAAVFAAQLDDARRVGRWAAVRLTARELTALAGFAWTAHREAARRRRVDDDRLAAGRRPAMVGAFVQDLRYATRLMWRSPGYVGVCVLTIALAIGANTAIFSVFHGVLLKALPFAEPDRLVVLGHHTAGGEALDSTTAGNLYDWMRGATAFEAIAGYSATERIVTVPDGTERMRGVIAVGPLFEVLGRQAAVGRALTAADDDPAAPRVVVVSDGLARRLFPGRSAVGEALTINGEPHAVVGVMPEDFAFFDYGDQYWLPARFDTAFRDNRDQYFLSGLARLRADTTREQARVQLNTVMDAIRRAHPQFTENAVAGVVPLREVLLDGVERRLTLLMGAAAFVLLIACANLGNLLMARATERRREMAVRHALGAATGRLARQALAETVWLAATGGVGGVVVGAVLVSLLTRHLPADLPRLGGVALDGTVLAFTAGVTLAAGLLIGVFPAMRVTSADTLGALRDGTRVVGRGSVVRAGLIGSQVALTLMLLAGAALLARSFAALTSVPRGFAAERLLTVTVSVPTSVYRTVAERSDFFERAATALEALPGVRAVTMTTALPVDGRGAGAWFNRLDRPTPPDRTPPAVPYRIVRANYFAAMGIALRRGRGFTAEDGAEGRAAVVVSESVARRFFAGEDPIGKRIYLGAPDNRVVPDAAIVGVVVDVKQRGLDEEGAEAVYAPHRGVRWAQNMTLAIRTAGDPRGLAAPVRTRLRALDPRVPLTRLQTMDDIVARALAPTRSSMTLVSVFAGVALVLAVVGVFGVVSYAVAQQRGDLAVRLALGATASAVLRLVLGRGLVPVAIGAAVGLGGAVAMAPLIGSLLFGVAPTDPLTLGAATVVLLGTAAVAVALPARRATTVDPVEVLRQG
ncbi:MAG: ABC transporter permease [Vicinamibacterales bacterium]